MQMSHYYDSLKVSEMGYSRMGPFDLKVVLHQLNRGINHLLHGSQTLFAYTEFHFLIVFSALEQLSFTRYGPFLTKIGNIWTRIGHIWQVLAISDKKLR